MSAFIVEDTTINRVVSWLGSVIRDIYSVREELRKLGIDVNETEWKEDLGRKMFELNIAAVNTRYGEGEAEHFRALNYQYRYEKPCSRFQVLKSLRCWLYQCTEGDVPNEPLYTFFDSTVCRYLMMDIIDRMSEYDRAEWG